MAVAITEATKRILDNGYSFQSIGITNLKGAGELELYLVEKMRRPANV